jgi:signal transduction histidine kinase
MEPRPPGSAAPDEQGRSPLARPWLGVLGVPLAAKLAGASLLVAAAGVGAVFAAERAGVSRQGALLAAAAACLLALLVSFALLHLALRPVAQLQRTAERVWRGDLSARVQPSPLADPALHRVGDTLNRVLDGFVSDRARLRALAADVIRVGDEERARLSRELHDSTAQTLAALKLQLAALGHAHPAMSSQIDPIVELATAALEEVRTLAYMAYPQVLDDLGLPAALRWLARQISDDTGAPTVDVEAPIDPPLRREARAVLYRVAQEAIRNATRHASARHIGVHLSARDGGAELTVADDGRGFDVMEAERRRPGMGLFTMRERVGLVDGRLTIDSAAGRGTRISAWVPGGE